MRPPTAAQLLETEGAMLTRTHLAQLGLPRSAIDAVFRTCEVIIFPGTSRPMIRRTDFLALVETSTFGKDRVRAGR